MTHRSYVVGLLLFGLAGCAHSLRHDPVDEQLIIPRDGARSATVHLSAPGSVQARSGKCSLVQARARYDAHSAKAKANFTIDDKGHGNVEVEVGPTRPRVGMGGAQIDACLTTEIPLDLHTGSGTGGTELDLSGLQVRGLESDAGTGDVIIDTGDASIANATMSVDAGTGDIHVDGKRSRWTGENKLRIDAGTGDVTVYLPRDIGVRVRVDKGTGSVRVNGLERDGNGYTNALAESADDSVDVNIDVGTGDVAVIVG